MNAALFAPAAAGITQFDLDEAARVANGTQQRIYDIGNR